MSRLYMKRLLPEMEFYQDLARMAMKEYDTGGSCTHVTTTPLGETVLLFAEDEYGERFALVFSNPRAFLEGGIRYCVSDVWLLGEGALKTDSYDQEYLDCGVGIY